MEKFKPKLSEEVSRLTAALMRPLTYPCKMTGGFTGLVAEQGAAA